MASSFAMAPRTGTHRRRALLAAVVLPLVAGIGACRTPTQISVEVFTDLPCTPRAPRTILRVGALGALAGKAPTVDTTTCTGQRVGSLVLVPSGGKSDEVALEVVTRVGGGDPNACDETGPAATFDGCIVARRALRFVPHEELDLPIDLDLDCAGVKCDPTETCAKGGCMDAHVPDSSACHGDGCRFGRSKGVGDAGTDAPADAPASGPSAKTPGTSAVVANGVAVAPDGSIYAALTFDGVASFDRPLTAGGIDVVLVKLSPGGVPLWSRQLGGDGQETVTAVLVLPGGDVMVVGDSGSSSFMPEGGAAIPSGGGGGMTLVRYDAAGGYVVARKLQGGGDLPQFGGAALNAAGELVVGQTIASAIQWDGTLRDGPGDLDVAVGIFDPATLATKKVAVFPGSAGFSAEVGAMAMGKDGPVLVGQFGGTFAGLPPSTSGDGYVLALDAALAPRWVQSTVDVGTPDRQQLGAVAFTSTGDVLVAGGIGPATVRLAGHDFVGPGTLVAQLDPSGAFVRGLVFPTLNALTNNSAIDDPMALALGPAGDLTLYATVNGGASKPTFTFDPTLPPVTVFGAGDLLLVQLTTSSAGLVATKQRLLGDASAQASGRIVRAANGDLVLTGSYAGTLDLGVTPALPTAATTQGFVARIAP